MITKTNSNIKVFCLFLALFLFSTGIYAHADTEIPSFGIYPFENIHELKKLSWNMNIYTATQALTIPYETEHNDDGTSRIYAFPENDEIKLYGITSDGIVLDFNANDRLIAIGIFFPQNSTDKIVDAMCSEHGAPIKYDDGYYWDTKYHEIDIIYSDDYSVLYYTAHTSSDTKQYGGSGNTVIRPNNIENGQILIYPDYECVCPFSVSVSGDATYYIYLEYLHAPTNSTTDRQLQLGKTGSNYEPDISFFVSPNNTAEVEVPIGVYKLYYCYGKEWYGRDEKFGDSTRYASSDDLLTFYTDTQYYQGHSLELWEQYDGNFEDHPIPENQFPDKGEEEIPIPENTSHL